jgi:hypothetical protein
MGWADAGCGPHDSANKIAARKNSFVEKRFMRVTGQAWVERAVFFLTLPCPPGEGEGSAVLNANMWQVFSSRINVRVTGVSVW